MSELRQVSRAREIDPPLTPVYGAPIDHPSAWKGTDFKTLADYTIDLSATRLRDITRTMGQIKSQACFRMDRFPSLVEAPHCN